MLITRDEAIQQGLKYYFTGKPCPKGHVDKRKVHNSTCYTCAQSARDDTDRTKVTKRSKAKLKIAVPHPEYQRTQRRLARSRIIQHMGGKCVRCGFDDERALQIDHVNGGGKKELTVLSMTKYHKQVMSDQSGKYQLLCANCNWIKRVENDKCLKSKSNF